MDDLSENSTLYNKTGSRSILLTINNRRVNLPVNSTIINGTIVSNPMFLTPDYGLSLNNTADVNVTNLVNREQVASNVAEIDEVLTGTINEADFVANSTSLVPHANATVSSNTLE